MSNRHKGAIVRLTNVRPHDNADRLQCTTILGANVVIGLNNKVGDLGIFFGDDIQLSDLFCYYNNLYSNSELNHNTEIKGYFSENRRVKSQRFRGEKSEGIWLPIHSLEGFPKSDSLQEGDFIDSLGGLEICRKYINPATVKKVQTQGSQKAKKASLVPLFSQHMDTEQLNYYLAHIKDGDSLIVTEKLHGTSGRCGKTLAIRQKSWFERVLNKLGVKTPDTEDKFVVGSRTVIKQIGEEVTTSPGYCTFDIWSESAKRFEHLLHNGETVYYEIVGYLPNGQPIMNTQSNEKLKNLLNKDEYQTFIDHFGPTTIFSYNCAPNEYEVYVYRISITSSDGREYDLSWDQVKERCYEMGVQHVPELDRGVFGRKTFKNGNVKLTIGNLPFEIHIDVLRDKPSEIFPDHVKEGVCVRIDNRIRPKMLKSKSFIFKCLEGIIKESNAEDIEESQG